MLYLLLYYSIIIYYFYYYCCSLNSLYATVIVIKLDFSFIMVPTLHWISNELFHSLQPELNSWISGSGKLMSALSS